MFERRKQHKHQASGKAALMHSSSRIAAVQKATRQRQPRTTSCGASEANGEILKRWRLSRLKTLALAFSPSIRRCTWLPSGDRPMRTWHLRHESGDILLIDRASLEASNAQHTRPIKASIVANTASRDMQETRHPETSSSKASSWEDLKKSRSVRTPKAAQAPSE